MRTILLFIILLGTLISLDAQSRRMANPQTGVTYASQTNVMTPWPLLQTADQQMRRLDFEEAFFTLESAVAQFPESEVALIYRARLKRIIGMQAEAELDYRKASQLNPYIANLYGYNNNRGVLQLLTYQPEVAIQDLSTFKKLNYYYEYLDRNISEDFSIETLNAIEQVIRFIEEQNFEAARELLELMIAERTELALLYDLLGIIQLSQYQYEDALVYFNKAIALDVNFSISWYNLGVVSHEQGKLEAAKEYLDKAISLNSNLSKAYFERAMVLKKMGDKESALADYDTIISKKGALYPEAIINRGLTKKMIGAYAGALSDLNKVIDEYPQNADLFKNRGNLYLLTNLLPKAIDDYTQAIKLENNYAEAYYNRSLAHFMALDPVSACADLAKSSELGHPRAAEMLTYFCEN